MRTCREYEESISAFIDGCLPEADRAELEGRSLGAVTVALSPTPVSDGGGYAALWGGEEGKEAESYAA